MAQRITTVCDQHQAQDEDVAGDTWTLALPGAGGKLTTWEIDLCSECAQPLQHLADFLAELGRPVGKRPRKPYGEPDHDTPESARTCPECGIVSANRKAMRSHLWANHDKRLRDYPDGHAPPPAPTDYLCPECGRTFNRSQGLGAHRQRAHGVAGSSKDAVALRAKKQGR